MDSMQNKERDRFFLIVIFLLILFMSLRIPLDHDFWWHIRAGQDTVVQMRPILFDQYSFTRLGTPWINHSWLGQVILFAFYDLLALPGVMLLVSGLALACMWFIYKVMAGQELVKAFLLVFAVSISAVVWSPRPQLFSLAFLAFVQYLLMGFDRSKQYKYLVFIGCLFILWSNIHAGFSLGILYLIVWLLGETLENILAIEKKPVFGKDNLAILALILLSSVLVCINPNGINMWRVQLNTISVSALQNLIPEWASPNFHDLVQQPYLWVVLLLVGLALSISYRLRFSQIGLLIFFGYLGFVSKRNYGPFAIVAVPILSVLVEKFIQERVQSSCIYKDVLLRFEKSNKPMNKRLNRFINLSTVGVIMFLVAGKLVYLSSPVAINYYEKQLFPKEAATWLNSNDMVGNGMNEYAWGGYMLWHLPNVKVFVDGRTDLYGDEIILDWVEIVNNGENAIEMLKDYDIQWIFLENDRGIIKDLQEQGWQTRYEDEMSIILEAEE